VSTFAQCEEVKFICNFREKSFEITKQIFLNCCDFHGSAEVLNENVFLVPSNIKLGSNIECFTAEKENFEYFPRMIPQISENLTNIVIKNSGLIHINVNNLKIFTHLQYLDLSYNKIEILEENVFRKNAKLTHLILSNNNIQLIHFRSFQNDFTIKYLDLRNNSLSSALASCEFGVFELIGSIRSSSFSKRRSQCDQDENGYCNQTVQFKQEIMQSLTSLMNEKIENLKKIDIKCSKRSNKLFGNITMFLIFISSIAYVCSLYVMYRVYPKDDNNIYAQVSRPMKRTKGTHRAFYNKMENSVNFLFHN